MRLLGTLVLLWMGCVTALAWITHVRITRLGKRIATLEEGEGISLHSRDSWTVQPTVVQPNIYDRIRRFLRGTK